jgi:hypothetical protein
MELRSILILQGFKFLSKIILLVYCIMSETLYTVVGAVIGLAAAVYPTAKHMGKGTGGPVGLPLLIAVSIGPIIVGGAIGKASYEQKPM